MDPVTAIGLAANVFQFIEYGIQIFSESRELASSASGSTNANAEIEKVAKRLQVLASDLVVGDLKSRRIANVASSQEERTRESIVDIAEDCSRISAELISAIPRLTASAKGGKWKGFFCALRTLWSEKSVRGLKDRLITAESTLRTHILTLMSISQQKMQATLDGIARDLLQLGCDREDHVTQMMSSLNLSVDAAERSPSNLSTTTVASFRTSCSQIGKTEARLSQELAILDSLQYGGMRVRFDAISEAHHQTFEWILKHRRWPASDPRSKIRFRHWLRSSNGLYWISGKPGSGKSTLMKFIASSIETQSHLRFWSKDERLCIADFYFWIAGRDMQHSQKGLFQGLLFEILRQRPDLIASLCPELSNKPASLFKKDWTLKELFQCLERLKLVEYLPTKFFFLIDGLDEYGDKDPSELIKKISYLASLPNIKICVSSRPWLCFKDAFGKDDVCKLALQDLTRSDMTKFVKDKLSDLNLRSLVPRSSDESTQLIDEVVQRSEGVFLWVYLVVRSLREGIQNGDDFDILYERLLQLPSDLEEFFERLISSVDSVYQKQMAASFQVTKHESEQISLVLYKFIGLGIPSHRRTAACIPAIDDIYNSLTHQLHETEALTERQLTGRYKGLLEVTASQNVGGAKVHFLHRTVRDFLQTPAMQAKFKALLTPDFSAPLCLCEAVAAMATTFPGSICEESLEWFHKWAVEAEQMDPHSTTPIFKHISREDQSYLQLVGPKMRFEKMAIKGGFVDWVWSSLQEPTIEFSLWKLDAWKASLFKDQSLIRGETTETTATEIADLILDSVLDGDLAYHATDVFSVLLKWYNMPETKLYEEPLSLDRSIWAKMCSRLLERGVPVMAAFSKTSWFAELVRPTPHRKESGLNSLDIRRDLPNVLSIFFEHGLDPNLLWDRGRPILHVLLEQMFKSPYREQYVDSVLVTFMHHNVDVPSLIKDQTLRRLEPDLEELIGEANRQLGRVGLSCKPAQHGRRRKHYADVRDTDSKSPREMPYKRRRL